jgi:hypothetical protein
MGYAVFHKEVNLLSGDVSCAEFSLVKLDLRCPAEYSQLAKATYAAARRSGSRRKENDTATITTSSGSGSGSSSSGSGSSGGLFPTTTLDKKAVADEARYRRKVSNVVIELPTNRFVY